MIKFPEQLRSLLIFTAAERRGAYILLGLLLTTATIRFMLPLWLPVPDFPEEALSIHQPSEGKMAAEETEPTPFVADTMNRADWENLGVAPKLASRIENFMNKGGQIRYTADLKKIYGMDRETYEKLSAQMVAKSSNQPNRSSQSSRAIATFQLTDLNQADSATLVKLQGIGPVSASKIIRYRNRLGGFVSLNQLYEIKGIAPEWLSMALPKLVIQSPHQRLNLNSEAVERFKAHPYINWKFAGWLDARRKQKPFTGIDEVKQFPLMNDSLFQKVSPYLEP